MYGRDEETKEKIKRRSKDILRTAHKRLTVYTDTSYGKIPTSITHTVVCPVGRRGESSHHRSPHRHPRASVYLPWVISSFVIFSSARERGGEKERERDVLGSRGGAYRTRETMGNALNNLEMKLLGGSVTRGPTMRNGKDIMGFGNMTIKAGNLDDLDYEE